MQLMLDLGQTFGEDVCSLVLSWDELRTHFLVLDVFADEVMPDVDVLRPLVMNIIFRELNGPNIVGIDDRRIANGETKFPKE